MSFVPHPSCTKVSMTPMSLSSLPRPDKRLSERSYVSSSQMRDVTHTLAAKTSRECCRGTYYSPEMRARLSLYLEVACKARGAIGNSCRKTYIDLDVRAGGSGWHVRWGRRKTEDETQRRGVWEWWKCTAHQLDEQGSPRRVGGPGGYGSPSCHSPVLPTDLLRVLPISYVQMRFVQDTFVIESKRVRASASGRPVNVGKYRNALSQVQKSKTDVL
ncbi:hypothetical protein SAICODRAFT_132560 [Saitoella complicata NRRL Y-17804]|uniref:uncharacterized protein n=1 Tax=Saitoella complicata (strain BCRC 22490 / CBS 7301 / JCM 7358 / NBRC 10748 / NRRL Y-17804) TaxID=698492 RepID=UPI000866D536|nr:uncharacterized protein SAICODRAFT_132560 [Saitoella complicata NRRL Y-17804]ODQ52273.1 hypothetical protein SAICODRAFT_132560 [Saitoella complicata NRRL Y-17804]